MKNNEPKIFSPIKNKIIIMDYFDYIKYNHLKLYISTKSKYSSTNYVYLFINKKKIYLHRLITNCTKGLIVDHIDGNGLNNCKSNLRICSYIQNGHNRKAKKNSLTGFKGVYKRKDRENNWIARIIVNGKDIYIGSTDTPEKAAAMYNTAAIKYFGDFALLNNIKGENNV